MTSHHLLDKLHNLRQDHISVQDYIAIFEDFTHRCDMREHRFQTITRFVSNLKSKIRHVMINDSYDFDTVKEAFDVILKIDLTFKRLINVNVRYSKCEGYRHYDYQCPSESQHVRIVPSDNVEDSKVVEDVNILPKITSIVEDKLVHFGTPIVDEVHMSSDSTSNGADEIVESNIPAVLSKSFEFPCADYEFMVVPAALSSSVV